MLFRDAAESETSSVDQEDYSSGGCSLASSESYCTRAFENRMKLLLENVPALEKELPKTFELLDVVGFEKNAGAGRNSVNSSVSDVGGEEGQVSCFNYDNEFEWGTLVHDPEADIRSDTQFHEYPSPEYFKAHPPKQVGADESGGEGGGNASGHHHHGTKMFIGGLRFEVVQVGRHLISWIFEVGCGVRLPPNSILVHRKAKGGRSGSPTGCASVFVASETDVELLLSMNQRIFCGVKGVYVASSVERMAELIASKRLFDVGEGRTRGPTHPVIIERAYSSTGNHHAARSNASTTSCQETASNSLPPQTSASPVAACSVDSSHVSNMSVPLGPGASASGSVPPGLLQPLTPSKEPVYHTYPGDAEAKRLLQHASEELQRPCTVFVGGFPAKVDREFVAWVFLLMDICVHPNNVTLYVEPQSGEKDDCALVRMERQEVSKATAWSKRVLCDARGAYMAATARDVLALVAAREKTTGRPLVITRRRDGGGGGAKPPAAGSPGPLPPPFPGAWQPGPARPPPPPYMQNVIIGNQAYQVPLGASIQLQLVPVITGPNIAPGSLPIQAAPLPVYQPTPYLSPPTLR